MRYAYSIYVYCTYAYLFTRDGSVPLLPPVLGDRVTLIRRQSGGPTATTSDARALRAHRRRVRGGYPCVRVVLRYLNSARRCRSAGAPETGDSPVLPPRRSQINTVGDDGWRRLPYVRTYIRLRCSRHSGINIRRVTRGRARCPYCCAVAAALSRAHISDGGSACAPPPPSSSSSNLCKSSSASNRPSCNLDVPNTKTKIVDFSRKPRKD